MRLLLVEDDAALSRQLKDELVKCGFAVDIVNNGIDAEFMGDEEPYDVIILDLGLPGRPGLEVLKNWRSTSIMREHELFLSITHRIFNGYEL